MTERTINLRKSGRLNCKHHTETEIKSTVYDNIGILHGFRCFWNAFCHNDCVTLSHSYKLILTVSEIAFPGKYVLV